MIKGDPNLIKVGHYIGVSIMSYHNWNCKVMIKGEPNLIKVGNYIGVSIISYHNSNWNETILKQL